MRVPVYERRSGIAALPAVQSPVLMPENDGGNAIAGAVRNLADRAIKIHNDWEDSRTLELFSKFKADSADFHDNPDTGILSTRTGYLSQGLFQDADNWMRKRGEDYARQLHSPRAKNNFRRMASDFITQQGHTNSRFEAAQMKKYRTETADAAVKNYLADIEAHWDDTDYIKRAREAINQALELKHRGEGREVFFNAGLEVDDQIAQARIRQAYLRDPLRAVQLLNDRDIKLKPDTRAKLAEALRSKTEIYELRAIAEEYAKQFSPENQSEAENKLIQTYGADKGQKAFAELSRIWSIRQSQDSAVRQRKAREQDEADEAIRWRFLRRDDTLTEQEVRNNKNISAYTASTVINGLKARKNEAERLQAEQKKLENKKAEIELEILSWSGNWASDEFLQGFAHNGMDRDYLHSYRERREAHYKKTNQSRIDDTNERLTRKIVNPDKYGSLTVQEIQSELDKGNLDAKKAETLKNSVEAREKAEQAQAAKNEEEARKQYQTSLRIIAENGGIIPHKTVNTLLTKKLIDESFAMYLYGKEDAYNTEQEKIRKQAEKEQAEQDKLQLKEKLYAQAQQFAKVYPSGQSGKGQLFIQSLNIPVDDKKQLLSDYNEIIEAQKQMEKDTSNEVKQNREALIDIELINIMNGKGLSRERYRQLRSEGVYTDKEYDKIIAELDKKDNADAKVRDDETKKRARENADYFFDYFGSARQGKAYQAINSITDEYERELTERFFNSRLAQERSIRSEEDRRIAENQRLNFINLEHTYWRNFKPVPREELDKLRDNKGLTEEQFRRAEDFNESISNRNAIYSELLRANPDFGSWELHQQDEQIMLRMGTDETARKNNVAYLLKLLEDDNLSDALVDHYFYHGRISTEDRDYLKDYDKRFDKQQKAVISYSRGKLIQFIQDLGIHNNDLKQKLLSNVRLSYMLFTSSLDTRAKDFNAQIQQFYDSMLESIANEYKSKVNLKGFWGWGRSPAGVRFDNFYAEAKNYNVPEAKVSLPYRTPDGEFINLDAQGNQAATPDYRFPQEEITHVQHDPYHMSAPVIHVQTPTLGIYPQRVQDMISGSETKPRDIPMSQGIVDFTRGILDNVAYRITDGYYAAKKAYRQFRSHFAIDLAAPEGTTVRLGGNGIQWKIRTGKGKAAGNFITASTTTNNGDNLEITYGHLSSADVRNGDILTSGDIIGKSGSTGNVTGPHLHISAKLNGKPVDPRKIDFGSPNGLNSQYVPPPVVSSDEEQKNAIRAALADFFNSSSWDIFDTSGNFGVK